MRYEVGDRVKVSFSGRSATSLMHKSFKKLDPPYVFTIYKVCIVNAETDEEYSIYAVEEFCMSFHEIFIESLYQRYNPVKSRFDILDL